MSNCEKCQQDIGKNQLTKEERRKFGNLNEYYVKNNRTGKENRICPKCNICSYCQAKKIETMTNEDSNKWKADVWLCKDCYTNATPREEDKKISQLESNKPNREREREQNWDNNFSEIPDEDLWGIRHQTCDIHYYTNAIFLSEIKEKNIQQINLSYNKAFPKGVLIFNNDPNKRNTNLITPKINLKEYLKKQNKTVITRTELENIFSSSDVLTEAPTNYLPWIFGVLSVVLVIFIIWWTFKRGIKGRCRNCRSPKFSCDCPLIVK